MTVVGLYSIGGYKSLIRGENLTEENLQRTLNEYKYLITFYGTIFDIPFLKKEFPNLQIEHIPHFDLFLRENGLEFREDLKNLKLCF